MNGGSGKDMALLLKLPLESLKDITSKIMKPIQRLGRWFLEVPFQELPPEFGDAVLRICGLSRPTPRRPNIIPGGVSNRHLPVVPNKPSLAIKLCLVNNI